MFQSMNAAGGCRTKGIAGRLIVAAIALGLLLPLAIAVKTFLYEYSGFDTAGKPVHTPQAHQVLPSLQVVSWESGGAILRGWFVPGRERAAVILVHGSGGNRDDILGELEILSRAGFTVLTFDWPGHGQSGGHVEWDEPERAAMRSSIDWLSARPEVNPHRIGAFGFSLGTVPLLQVAVRDPRIRALALAGAPSTFEEQVRQEYRKYGLISQLPALWADRAHGMHLGEQVPLEIVGQLAPRPLFLVLGEKDQIVLPASTRALFAAARDPKDLLVLPGAGHGEYRSRGGAVYAEHLTMFFVRGLVEAASTEPQLSRLEVSRPRR